MGKTPLIVHIRLRSSPILAHFDRRVKRGTRAMGGKDRA